MAESLSYQPERERERERESHNQISLLLCYADKNTISIANQCSLSLTDESQSDCKI